MSLPRTAAGSAYMEWAKTRASARFNLATSGIRSLPLADLPVRIEELEITGDAAYGFQPLQERLARHCSAPSACVVAAIGTSMANHLALAALLEPGDEVVVERPAYGPLLDVAAYLGARVRRFDRRFEDGFAVDPAEVERAVTGATRLVVLTNFHNPSGCLVSRESLTAVGEIARRVGARVLVDEVYLEMLFDPEAPFAFPLGEPFVTTASLTKAYGLSGLRCGWVLAPAELAERMWKLNDLFGAGPPHLAERVSVVALDHLVEIAARSRALLAQNRRLLDAFLDSRDELEVVRPTAGTIVFPRLPGVDPEAFFTRLRERYETSVVPGRFFEMERCFRLGIGIATDELRGGLERLGAALDEAG